MFLQRWFWRLYTLFYGNIYSKDCILRGGAFSCGTQKCMASCKIKLRGFNIWKATKTNGRCFKWTRTWVDGNQSFCASGFNSGTTIFSYVLMIFNLQSIVKLFTDDTSMFSVVNEPVTSSVKLNKDLVRWRTWGKGCVGCRRSPLRKCPFFEC